MKTHFAQAIDDALQNKLIPSKTALACALWPKSGTHAARANLRNVVTGATAKVSIKNVQALCRTCHVSADYLFGLTEIPNYEDAHAELKANLKDIARTIDEFSHQI